MFHIILINRMVSEEKRFEYYDNIHENCPSRVQMNPCGPIVF